jgi:hypothetical protein
LVLRVFSVVVGFEPQIPPIHTSPDGRCTPCHAVPTRIRTLKG